MTNLLWEHVLWRSASELVLVLKVLWRWVVRIAHIFLAVGSPEVPPPHQMILSPGSRAFVQTPMSRVG